MNTITENAIQSASSADAVTRERRYASTAEGPRVDLEVYRGSGRTKGNERGKVYISWNVDRGAGWQARAWRTVRTGPDAEAQAFAFAEEKWATLMAWLGTVEPKAGEHGAAEAFSAQVATMTR